MKAIKLLFSFILLLGGLIVTLYLINGHSTDSLPPISDNTYQKFSNQIKNEWAQRNDWDDSLYFKHRDLVHQLSKKFETRSLSELVTNTAIEIVYDKIFGEWEKTTCQKPVVDNYVRAIGIIEKEDSNAKTNPNVIKIKDVNKSYKSAYSFAHQSVGISPNFDGQTWKSFSNYNDSITKKRTAILNDANYRQYLTNINEIKTKLNDISNKLSEAKTHFYNTLAKEIIKYYSKIDSSLRNRSELNKLRNHINTFNNEYSPNNDLREFSKSFAKDVTNNEKRNNEQ